MIAIKKMLIKNNFTDGNFPKKYIAIHETDNWAPGANAMAHYKYWDEHPEADASAHFVVDDTEVIQLIDLEDKSWAVGVVYGNPRNNPDANNFNTINVEICVNADGNYLKARQNAIELVKQLLQDTGLPSEAVIRHYDACLKWCPRTMLDNPYLWEDFKRQVSKDIPGEATDNSQESISGGAVEQLQKSLNTLGFKGANGLPLDVDGINGVNTTYATKTFQTVVGLDADGIAGVMTNGAIEEILTKPLTKMGTQKPYAVRYIQNRVGALVDGDFGRLTDASVKRWQNKYGLVSDGIVGQNTWKSLIGK